MNEVTRCGNERATTLRRSAVASIQSRLVGSFTGFDAPASRSATGWPIAAAKPELIRRNVCTPIGVNGSNIPCATFAEK